MKSKRLSITALVLGASLAHLSLTFDRATGIVAERFQEKQAPFAVAELFTSEGCSTCPKADKMTSELYEAYRAKNQAVYLLAFHVDYWDEYGWTDHFGKAEFSRRQRKYVSALRLESAYTPQLIINGTEEMVGSDPKAKESIDSALQKSAEVAVTVSVSEITKKKITVHYTLSSIPTNSVLNLAVVERGLVREIWRGENSGRTLKHDHVVRSFKTIKKPDDDGISDIDLPSDMRPENGSVVVYLQDSELLKIIGAAGIDLK